MPRPFLLLPLLRGHFPALFLALTFLAPEIARAQTCARTITADVVAFDQVFFWNRMGAVQPQGMMYALRRDVVPISGTTLSPGNVKLRVGKRPRPLVLRMNVGDCLQVQFQNLLAPTKVDEEQPATRRASMHAVGLQLVSSIDDDGSFVGTNASSLAAVNQSRIYTWYAEREGEHVINSLGATNGGQGDGGSTNSGLFGAVIVEPQGAKWYRSQVTRADLDAATTGTTSTGHPIINYEALSSGIPILNMLNGTTIVHSDLTAIIAGSSPGGASAGWFPAGTFPENVTYPERHQPFREFVTIYHDEIGAVQAFPIFEDKVFSHTLHGGRDAFAINYGTGGIGAEILGNRFEVGPMHDCAECKFEEFFLTSWAVGDPAMVVDVPANHPCTVNDIRSAGPPTYAVNPCTPTPGAKATKAFYPDDPSNVYHSYLSDHTKFRVLHAGSKEHHIHHLHAHQWLFAPDSDKSSYLDSQAIGPGSSFTAEIAHNGSGNLNKTVGDSIFHCHFYPHFAQGMWSLWRVHDVFERGTILNDQGRPATGANRALPDGEIPRGTPIPALVPLPGKAMAPLPGATVAIASGQAQVTGTGNPGFPFYIPATAGHRPPKPPFDTAHDGGLPRHKIQDGTFVEAHTRLDFHKELLTAVAAQLPENGTTVEQQAMAFHAIRNHASCTPAGVCTTAVKFVTNGRPAVAGAPFADPCIDATGQAVGTPRTFKIADIQDDVKLNKKGWHFPQQRFSSLWEDVDDFLAPFGTSKKPPEPLFFRANSRDCIQVQLTNLVPHEYALDDFQVRTPTDILGQHIHLVKFDVTSSDGAGNGFNYEDGSFAPAEVRERIAAIRAQNNCTTNDPRNNTFACPKATLHPFVPFQKEEWRGAQTTIQRWYADPLLDNSGNDRTLRTVFTHDHFGPSTHQQAGLYAGLVVEPTGATWKHNETGAVLGGRHDGGPTSWQAVIIPPGEPDYREFLLAFGDFQLAYSEDATTFPNRAEAINPPARNEIGLPDLLEKRANCPGGVNPPCPEIISADDPGTMSVNYRQEPVALRVRNPATNTQATGNQGDLSFAFASMTRADTDLNVQPTFYDDLTLDQRATDPFTPLLRTYDNDRVQIRVLVGAHEEGHNFSVHGIKWLFEPSEQRSGYRNSQMMGISEHFEFIIPQLVRNTAGDFVDRLWSAGSSTDDYWNGLWGLMRSYEQIRNDLEPLPDNPRSQSGLPPEVIAQFDDHSCPISAPLRTYEITAVSAQQALPQGRLIYNSRTDGAFGPLFDPTAILYVHTADLNANLTLKAGVPVEPLVLRARAGECVKVTLDNKLPSSLLNLDGFNTLPMIVEGFNANDIKPSNKVGLHPQMLYYDPSRDDGANIGRNPTQTAAPAGRQIYKWYAGDVRINPNNTLTLSPIEFGATNLISSDRILHASKGAIGALIIEPETATWTVDPNSRAVATVTNPAAASNQDAQFKELVLLFQNDVNMRTGTGTGNGTAVKNLAEAEDPEDSGQKAVNYRTEPLWKRMQHDPDTPLEQTRDFTDWYDVVSNSKVGGDPKTPVFLAEAGQPIRFRLLQPGGHSRNIVFALHGHIWDKEPYLLSSKEIGRNSFSLWEGAHMGHGPTNHFDAVIRNGAGGKFSILGDYLFRDQSSFGFDGGLWGILRVE